MDNIKIPKLDKKDPIILNKDEINSLLNATTNSRHKLLINLMLTSGLRVSEVVSIKIQDINFDDKTIRVRSSKGNRDRLTILSNKTIDSLREYLGKRKDENPYLFSVRDSHITIKLPQKIIKQSARKANLDKRIFCHALRSTFSQVLLENNIESSTVKELLGYNNFNGNVYSQVFIDKIKKIKNPFDNV